MNPPNTIASDTLVEAIARALCVNDDREPDDPFFVNSPDGLRQWKGFEFDAMTALTAITEAGYVVCPREPTEAMTVLMAEAVEAATEIIADGNFDRPARLQALAAHAAFIDAATNNGKAE